VKRKRVSRGVAVTVERERRALKERKSLSGTGAMKREDSPSLVEQKRRWPLWSLERGEISLVVPGARRGLSLGQAMEVTCHPPPAVSMMWMWKPSGMR